MATKQDFLKETIEHIDMKKHNVVPIVDDMKNMAFSARDLAQAAEYYDMMLKDERCSVVLCLAGSLISAGLKLVIVDMVRNNMVDAIVSTGANIVDQDFFEGLGFKHYKGSQFADDNELRDLMIDRIYDTYIDEEDLRVTDMTIAEICDKLEKRPYSSREFIYVEDAAEGIVLATERYNGAEPVNLGTGQEITIRELVNTIVELTGYEGEIRWDATKPDGQPRRRVDNHRARDRFGFQAATTFADGLASTVAWYLANRDEAEARAN